MPGNVNECQTHPPVFCPQPSTLQTPSTAPSACGWPWPRSHQGTWEINWAGLLAQQVPRLPSTHPGPICQLASCSAEPWQQGTASPARLHYACQMGWELDSNSHHGGREWRDWGERWQRRREEGRKLRGEESNGFCFHLCCKLLHFNVTPLGPGSIKCLFLNNRH